MHSVFGDPCSRTAPSDRTDVAVVRGGGLRLSSKDPSIIHVNQPFHRSPPDPGRTAQDHEPHSKLPILLMS